MENEEDDVQDIYVDQDEDEQGSVPGGGDVQSLQVHTDRGAAILHCHFALNELKCSRILKRQLLAW